MVQLFFPVFVVASFVAASFAAPDVKRNEGGATHDLGVVVQTANLANTKVDIFDNNPTVDTAQDFINYFGSIILWVEQTIADFIVEPVDESTASLINTYMVDAAATVLNMTTTTIKDRQDFAELNFSASVEYCCSRLHAKVKDFNNTVYPCMPPDSVYLFNKTVKAVQGVLNECSCVFGRCAMN